MIPTVDLAEAGWLWLAREALEDLGVVRVKNAVPEGPCAKSYRRRWSV